MSKDLQMFRTKYYLTLMAKSAFISYLFLFTISGFISVFIVLCIATWFHLNPGLINPPTYLWETFRIMSKTFYVCVGIWFSTVGYFFILSRFIGMERTEKVWSNFGKTIEWFEAWKKQ